MHTSAPTGHTSSNIAMNLRDVEARIAHAFEACEPKILADAANAPTSPSSHPRLLVATKTQSSQRVLELFAAGHTLVGENRVQEVTAKASDLAKVPHEMHLIGPLQSNKINAVLPYISCIQSVDSVRLARAISQRIESARGGRQLDVMVQVNVSGEASKSGCEPGEAVALAQAIAVLPGLKVVGLMTIGLNSSDEKTVRDGYAELRELRNAIQRAGVATCRELSMGMSNDMEWAIAEGATMVRVGTAIFGTRDATPATLEGSTHAR